jgi:hypothetical protein
LARSKPIQLHAPVISAVFLINNVLFSRFSIRSAERVSSMRVILHSIEWHAALFDAR